MEMKNGIGAIALVVVLLLLGGLSVLSTQTHPSSSALILFGDSTLDVGNNNFLPSTIQRCDHPPYGKRYADEVPTGRWGDGEISIDYVADALFLPRPLPYLHPYAKGKNITKGINFASGAAGLLDSTSSIYNVISFPQQLQYFDEYKKALAKELGSEADMNKTIKNAFYVISIGTNDYMQNYLQNAILRSQYNPKQFATLLLETYETHLRALYSAGARNLSIASLPPMGCVPFVIDLVGDGSSSCVHYVNTYASDYNTRLKDLLNNLTYQLEGSKFSYADTYTKLNELIQHPFLYGYNASTVSIGCCGLGRKNYALSCNISTPICKEEYPHYVFFDAFHLTEYTRKVLATHSFTTHIFSNANDDNSHFKMSVSTL